MCLGLAEKYDADFVFVDAGPSNDDLNRVCPFVRNIMLPACDMPSVHAERYGSDNQ